MKLLSFTGALFMVLVFSSFYTTKTYAADPCAYDASKISLLSTSFGKRSVGTGTPKNPGAGYHEFVFTGEVGDYWIVDAHMYVTNGFECGGPEIPISSSTRISVVLPSGTHQVADVSSSIRASNGITTARGPNTIAIDANLRARTIDFQCFDENPFKTILEALYPTFCAEIDAFYADNPRTVEHAAGGSLALPWFTDVAVEDEAINTIASGGSITLKTGSSPSIDFPATNCVKIAGPDPEEYAKTHKRLPIRVAIMRGKSIALLSDSYRRLTSVQDFMNQANDLMTNGFGAIEPYRSHIGDFTFYLDLKKIDDSDFTGSGSHNNQIVKGQSSCGAGNIDHYIFFYKDAKGIAWNAHEVSYVDISGGIGELPLVYATTLVAMHEFSHGIAGLQDEYLCFDPGPFDRNCSSNPKVDFTYDNKWYGAKDALVSPDKPGRFAASTQSIMRNYAVKKLNVISCGYVIAAINREITSDSEGAKGVAEKYWPECMKMDTAKGGIPAPNLNTPSITPPPTSQLNMWSALFASVKNLLVAQVSSVTGYTVNVVPRMGTKILTSAENGSCVSTIITPAGENTAGCVRSLTTQVVGTYRIKWEGGYPVGADTTKPPVISPSYPQSLGERPVGTSPITFYIDFTAKSRTQPPDTTPRPGYSASPGFPLTISGTNFTPDGNSVFLKNLATGQSFKVSDISTASSVSLQFIVPSSAPAGTYEFKIGAFNSDWSNSMPLSIGKAVPPIVTLSANNVSIKEGDSVFVTWSSIGADSCIKGGTIDSQALATWSASSTLSGNATIFPRTNGSLSITCSGAGGQTSQSLSITVSGYAAPEISLSYSPTNITAGQPATITWNVTKATSCTGSGDGDSQIPNLWNKTLPVSGSLTFNPLQNANLTLSCTGAGNAVSQRTINVEVAIPTVTASCSPVSSSVNANQLVTFNAQASGGYGSGTYKYLWTGTDGLVGSASSVSKIYPTGGSKTASLVVSSHDRKSATTTCSANVFPSWSPNNLIQPVLAAIAPTEGVPGTQFTIYGLPFATGLSTVVIERGGQKIYVRPTSIKQVNSTSFNLTFTFEHSAPLPDPTPGARYDVRVINTTYPATAPSAAVSFTLSTTQPLYPEKPYPIIPTASMIDLDTQAVEAPVAQNDNQSAPAVSVPARAVKKPSQGTVAVVSSRIERTVPSNETKEVQYDFGGIYAKTSTASYNNPATSGLSCPDGYSAKRLLSSPLHSLTACLRPHTTSTETLYDFGGFTGAFEGKIYPNTLVNGIGSCSEGYLSAQVSDSGRALGTPLSFCYKPHEQGTEPLYKIGAMDSGNVSCASGYTKETYGTSGNFGFCYKK